MRIVIVLNDKSTREGIIAKHGLSILLDNGGFRILFDMGPDEKSLENNMLRLGIDASKVDVAVVSHPHSDHYGGFKHVAWENPHLTTYIPYGSMNTLGKLIRSYDLMPFETLKTVELAKDTYLTRPFYGPPFEHYLVHDLGDELLVVSGCLHPGVESLREVSSIFHKKIGVLIGGYHLRNAPDEVIKRTVDSMITQLGIRRLIPLHCTGDRAVSYMEERYRSSLIKADGGFELNLP
ncbi:MAG: MBL fold metallo-hydrolase [Thermosphaera sp.]